MKDNKHEILVTVEGGVITGVSNIPEGYRIVVMDYDVTDTGHPQLRKDSNGERYCHTEHE